MLGEFQGRMAVNAEKGKVNAGFITGTGNITAKQINIAAFSGSNLDIKASNSVTVGGNIDATGSLTIGELNGLRADVIIQTDETIAAKEISILSKDIESLSEDLVISSEHYEIDAQGAISIGGNVNVVGDAKTQSTIKAATEVIIGGTADLANTIITAPQVSIGKGLTLNAQSRVEGNVTLENGATITVNGSTITGKVCGTESDAVTVKLTNATIGSAEKFSELVVKSASPSRITSNLTLMDGAKLSFTLDRLHADTPALTIGGELMVDGPDNPNFTIDLAGTNLPVGSKYALITTSKKTRLLIFGILTA